MSLRCVLDYITISKRSGMVQNSNLVVDFFVAGFPKCGTTSLATYLAAHPNICFSSTKEPFFFCTDFPRRQTFTSWEKYRKLYSPNEQTRVIGEGTACYVYSAAALSAIAKHNPKAKLIFMVRNPVELVHSLHSNQLHILDEDVSSIEQAWNLQAVRRKGRCIPKTCSEPFFLQYKNVASQGLYLQRVSECFLKSQVLILFFDDLKNTPETVYHNALKFLNLPSFALPSFEKTNANLEFKDNAVGQLGRVIRHIMKNQRLLEIKRHLGINNPHTERLFRRFFMQQSDREHLSREFTNRLIDEFSDDIQLLSTMTSRNLSSWLEKT